MSTKAVQSKKIIAGLCPACGAGMLVQNQFCRQCGAQQGDVGWADGFSSHETVLLGVANDEDQSVSYSTTLLEETFYHAVSAPLIKTATVSLTATKTEQLRSPWSKGLIMMLVLVPIWLMIVLLSPLDAYVAAKTTLDRE